MMKLVTCCIAAQPTASPTRSCGMPSRLLDLWLEKQDYDYFLLWYQSLALPLALPKKSTAEVSRSSKTILLTFLESTSSSHASTELEIYDTNLWIIKRTEPSTRCPAANVVNFILKKCYILK
ncbi:hypothetical protein SFRURICE_005089 [Spodoptera frugiperda]|nr:hypothetical protein SFRURICE_005089 [Spodoptera frugiperda]